MKLKYALFIIIFVISSSVFANDVLIRNNHPKRYQVKEGDTLWEIAGKFLQKPWQWKTIWRNNPQIENPHKIYPGDIIELRHINGKYSLVLSERGTVRLSPSVRSTPLDNPIPPIPLTVIKPFLTGSQVVTEDEMQAAPYIVAYADERLVGGIDTKVYASEVMAQQQSVFSIFRQTGVYKDPKSKKVLGYAALHVGQAQLARPGKPATLIITQSSEEVIIGDRLKPITQEAHMPYFIPQAPDHPIHGEIISVFGGVTQIGQYQVVVIDKGEQHGLQAGDVLTVLTRGEKIVDPGKRKKTLQLPDEPAGELMIFRTFPLVSFGLIMHATNVIHVTDKVANPT